MTTVEFANSLVPDQDRPGPGCSKLMTLLVNVSLKFQTLRLKKM